MYHYTLSLRDTRILTEYCKSSVSLVRPGRVLGVTDINTIITGLNGSDLETFTGHQPRSNTDTPRYVTLPLSKDKGTNEIAKYFLKQATLLGNSASTFRGYFTTTTLLPGASVVVANFHVIYWRKLTCYRRNIVAAFTTVNSAKIRYYHTFAAALTPRSGR